MNVDTTAKRDGSTLPDGSENSKSLWDYKNIFSFPNAWFLSILNYPSAEYWMLIWFTQAAKNESSFMTLWPTERKIKNQ